MDGTLFVHREFNGSYQLVGIRTGEGRSLPYGR